MTEIDFDELDKAVNSLMADVSKPAPETPASTPVNSSSTPAVSSTPTTNSVPVNGDTKSAAPSLAAKRRGQFMDIVRPAGGKPTTTPTRRQGVTIAPSVETDTTSTPDVDIESPLTAHASEATVPSESSNVESSVTPETTSNDTATKSEWPDPIDLAIAEEKDQTNDNSPSSAESTSDSSSDEASPLESPFLPDAKPEKRPLGVLTSPDAASPDEPSVDANEPPATPVDAINSSLPAELHGNVVAIESESTGQNQPSTAEVETSNATEPTEEILETPAEKSVENTHTPPGGGSIPQQYKEAPSTGDQTNGSIYDTANYHKAIEAHANGGKHGSAFKIAIWIVLLLVIGAGAGAAFFMITR